MMSSNAASTLLSVSLMWRNGNVPKERCGMLLQALCHRASRLLCASRWLGECLDAVIQHIAAKRASGVSRF